MKSHINVVYVKNIIILYQICNNIKKFIKKKFLIFLIFFLSILRKIEQNFNVLTVEINIIINQIYKSI